MADPRFAPSCPKPPATPKRAASYQEADGASAWCECSPFFHTFPTYLANACRIDYLVHSLLGLDLGLKVLALVTTKDRVATMPKQEMNQGNASGLGQSLQTVQKRNQTKLGQQWQTATECPPSRNPLSPQSEPPAVGNPKQSEFGENPSPFPTNPPPPHAFG